MESRKERKKEYCEYSPTCKPGKCFLANQCISQAKHGMLTLSLVEQYVQKSVSMASKLGCPSVDLIKSTGASVLRDRKKGIIKDNSSKLSK